MPHVSITMYPGRDNKIKAALAKRIRSTVADELGVSEDVVSVSVEDVEKSKWAEHIAAVKDEIMFEKPNY